MDFECPPRQQIITNFQDHIRGTTVTGYSPEEAFRCRTRPGVWQAEGLSNSFLAPATLANKLIQEQAGAFSDLDASTYDARRVVADEVEESLSSVWDQAHDLKVENNSGHWHVTFNDDSLTPHRRMWHQAPDSNVVLVRRGTAGSSDHVWQPKSAEALALALHEADVKAFIQRTTGSCDMYKLHGKTALDIWDAWAHNPAAETAYARQLGIPPFSISHLMVTFALIKNSGMEQMIMDDWTRTKDAIVFDDTCTTFSFMQGQSQIGSLPTILRHSHAGSVNTHLEALVEQIDRLP
jgi:hypothetical protein